MKDFTKTKDEMETKSFSREISPFFPLSREMRIAGLTTTEKNEDKPTVKPKKAELFFFLLSKKF
jgi:hypothetical protein